MDSRRKSFRVKIFIIIFIAILISVISASTIIYKRAEIAIMDQTAESVINNINFIVENTDSQLKAIYEMSNLIVEDERVLLYLNYPKENDNTDFINQYIGLINHLSSFLKGIKDTYRLNGVDSYYIYISEQKVLIDSKATYFEGLEREDIDFLNSSNDINTWYLSKAFEVNSLGINGSRLIKDKYITASKGVYDKNGIQKATLAINVDINSVGNSFSKAQSGNGEEFIIIDDNGEIFYDSKNIIIDVYSDLYAQINDEINAVTLSEGNFIVNGGNGEFFVMYSISEYTKWKYIVAIPVSQILEQIIELKKFVIILIIIIFIMLLLLTYFISNIFYNPLEKLVFAMQQIEERNLDFKIVDNRKDEYHEVYKGFNNMVSELKKLMEDLTSEKILKKEADIKLLQAQINPHFLYNTLQSIYSMAKIRKAEEIQGIVLSLSKFFRISLSGGKDDVILTKAVELVIEYLKIQNIRFGGKIDYSINIQDDLHNCIVPKLILQPIVENAIYHGIEKICGKGFVAIEGKAVDGVLQLMVEDNGVGICEDDLYDIEKSIDENNFEEENNYALKNINRQIKLKYGQDFGVKIVSKYNCGTKVFVALPIVKDEGEGYV